MIDKVYEQLKLGKTKKAIKILSSIITESGDDNYKILLKLEGDFNRLEKEKNLGIIRNEDADFKLSSINWTLINLVESIESSLPSINRFDKKDELTLVKEDKNFVEVKILDFEKRQEFIKEQGYIVMSVIFQYSKEIVRLYLKRIDDNFLNKAINPIKDFLNIEERKLKIIVEEQPIEELEILKPLTELYYLFGNQIEIKITSQIFEKPKGELPIGLSEFYFMVGDEKMYRMEYGNGSMFHGNFNDPKLSSNLITFFDKNYDYCEKMSLKINL